jgi:hypothetical protein
LNHNKSKSADGNKSGITSKKTSQDVPHVGNIACMNHADLNQTKLKSSNEGKRLVSGNLAFSEKAILK